MEMLRIFDAKQADIGHTRVLSDADMTSERLASLIYASTTEGSTGQIQRFRDYCIANCINRKLVLRDMHLGVNSARELVGIVGCNENVAHLDLCKNSLGDEGVGLLMKVIKHHRSLVHLNLANNSLSPEGMKRIFKSLLKNSSLISLDVGNPENTQKNRINSKTIPKMVELLAQTQVLQFLNIRNTFLQDQGLKSLCEGLKQNQTLVMLDLSKNDLTATSMRELNRALLDSPLKQLILKTNSIGNDGIVYLCPYLGSENCKLEYLNVSECKIQVEGMTKLLTAFNVFPRIIRELTIDHNNLSSDYTTSMANLITALKSCNIQTLSMN